MLIAYLVLASARPQFRAVFVSTHPLSCAPEIIISDARADLSAVGYAFRHWNSGSDEEPLIVLKGKPVQCPFDLDIGWKLGWYPIRLLRRDAVVFEQNADRLRDHQKKAEPHFRVGVLSQKRWRALPANQVPKEHTVGFYGVTDFSVPDQWWKKRFPDFDERRPYPDNGYRVEWWKPTHGFQVGSIRFREGAQGDSDPYTYYYFPVLQVGGIAKPLAWSVRNGKDLELYCVQFVSPEGWMVLYAKKHGQYGLVWLFPVR